jgi:ATP-binding cassette subfamily B protein
VVLLTVLEALLGGSGVLYALLLRELVDAATGGDRAGFWRFLVLIIGLVIVQLSLRAAIRRLAELSRSTFENLFKGRLLDALLDRDFLLVSAVHSGEWLNRLTSDAKVVADSYVEILPGLMGMVVKLISALGMILVLEPKFAAILIPGGAVLVGFTWLFRRKLKALHKKIQEADGRLRVFLQERIGSLLMIRSFAAEAQTRAAAEERMRAHQAARMRRNRFSNLANIGFGTAMNGMYLLGVGWCGYGILTGTISFGTLTAITQLITQIQTPFANITGYLPRYYAMLASAERLMEAEALESDRTQARNPEEVAGFYEKELKSIGLENAAFTYYPSSGDLGTLSKEEMPRVLHGLSLEIRKGETVAFTGHSGCGKSTALKLLMCVYRPDSGERYYTDAVGGRGDLSSAYRRLFAYVPQGNYLMSGTVREIVCFAAPEAARDGDRLRRALRIACAEDFVSELPEGADTLLGERGTGLSEGQMQRLAIARAIFSGSPILLLDEATSALDAATEARLLENLREMTDKTVVVVTHRSAALTICDRVLEFTENGVFSRDP